MANVFIAMALYTFSIFQSADSNVNVGVGVTVNSTLGIRTRAVGDPDVETTPSSRSCHLCRHCVRESLATWNLDNLFQSSQCELSCAYCDTLPGGINTTLSAVYDSISNCKEDEIGCLSDYIEVHNGEVLSHSDLQATMNRFAIDALLGRSGQGSGFLGHGLRDACVASSFSSTGNILHNQVTGSCPVIEFSADLLDSQGGGRSVPYEYTPSQGLWIDKCSGALHFSVPQNPRSRIAAESFTSLVLSVALVDTRCEVDSRVNSTFVFRLEISSDGVQIDDNEYERNTTVQYDDYQLPLPRGGTQCEKVLDLTAESSEILGPHDKHSVGLVYRTPGISSFKIGSCVYGYDQPQWTFTPHDDTECDGEFVGFSLENGENSLRIPAMTAVFDDGHVELNPQIQDVNRNFSVLLKARTNHTDGIIETLLDTLNFNIVAAARRKKEGNFDRWIVAAQEKLNDQYDDGNLAEKATIHHDKITDEAEINITLYEKKSIKVVGFRGANENGQYWQNLLCFHLLDAGYVWPYTLDIESVDVTDTVVSTSVDPQLGEVTITGTRPGNFTLQLTNWDNGVRLSTYRMNIIVVEQLTFALNATEVCTASIERATCSLESPIETNTVLTVCGIVNDTTCRPANCGEEAYNTGAIACTNDGLFGRGKESDLVFFLSVTELSSNESSSRRRRSSDDSTNNSLVYFVNPLTGAFSISSSSANDFEVVLTAVDGEGNSVEIFRNNLEVAIIVQNSVDNDDDEGMNDVTIVVIAIAACFLLVAVAAMVHNIRLRSKKKTKHDFTGHLAELNLDGTLNHSPESRITPKELQRSTIRMIEVIGSGEFGQVWKGVYRASRTNQLTELLVAVKELKSDPSSREREELMREAAVTAQFSHENVIGLIGVVTAGDPALLILPYCEKGSLSSLLKKKDHEISMLFRFCTDTAAGMKYLASRRFIHRDLAARNVLVNSYNIGKVADFGLSRDVLTSEYYKSVDSNAKLPLRWTAIEALQDQRFSEKSDVWAYAITCSEIFTNAKIPYPKWMNWYVLEMITEHEYKMEKPGTMPQLFYDKIMLPSLSTKPEDRPSFNEIVEILDEIVPSFSSQDFPSVGTTDTMNELGEVPYIEGNPMAMRESSMYMSGDDETIATGESMTLNPGFYAPATPKENAYVDQSESSSDALGSSYLAPVKLPNQDTVQQEHSYEYISRAEADLQKSKQKPYAGQVVADTANIPEPTTEMKQSEMGYVTAEQVQANGSKNVLYPQMVPADAVKPPEFPMKNNYNDEPMVFGFSL